MSRGALHQTLHGLAQAPRLNGWIYEQLRDGVRGDVLEIGSGIGNLSRFIVRDAHHAVLTDVDEAHLEILRRELAAPAEGRVEVAGYDLGGPVPAAVTRDGRRFDAIVAVNVLEHVADDRAAARELGALLRPGGSLLVYVPAGPWAFGTLDVALGHHRRYTRASLAALIEGAGLRLSAEPRHVNRLGLAGWWTSGKLLRRRELGGREIALFEHLVGAARMLDRVLGRVPLGLGLVARGEKQG